MEDWAEIRRLRRAEDLFRLDHLATRMRRNAENLVVLSGAAPSRRGRRPIPLNDMVRAAVAEVEDYTRIKVTVRPAVRGDQGPDPAGQAPGGRAARDRDVGLDHGIR